MTEKKSPLKTKLAAFIPRYVPNLLVAGVMGFLGVVGRTSKKQAAQNLEHNRELLTKPAAFYVEGAFIENQPFWQEVHFGSKYNMAYGGCEIFAVHNALLALGDKVDGERMAELIARFERKGAVLAGKLGIAPMAAYRFFRGLEYQTAVTGSRREEVWEAFEKQYDTFIVTAYNDANDIFRRIHTVNISKGLQGGYIIHNGFVNRRDNRGEVEYIAHGPFDSLSQAIQNLAKGKAAVICLIGIGEK